LRGLSDEREPLGQRWKGRGRGFHLAPSCDQKRMLVTRTVAKRIARC
jgi:hypothetical protein